MFRRAILIIPTLLFMQLSAWADAPGSGLVVEGFSVPGMDLGAERQLVEAVIGPPDFCQSVEVAGDRASCNHPVEGGGTVSIRYRGADGGNAANSPGDRVHAIRWYEAVDGWVTTAGVNTTLAASDPDAVVDAYPDAELTYNLFGDLYRARDADLGIEVTWVLDFYTGTTHVNMAIFSAAPVTPPPPPPPTVAAIHVAEIDLDAQKKKGVRSVQAVVRVLDDDDQAAAGALVSIQWSLPGGGAVSQSATTSAGGFAVFTLSPAGRGTHGFAIVDVQLEGHVFDAGQSTLNGSVKVR